jgi:GntR family transcriptional regulator
MDHLEDRGKIFRVPGKGSFVAFQKITHHTTQIMSFTEKMKTQGLSVKTELIRKEIVNPGEEIATALQLAPPFKALKLQRLRIVKDEPLALQTAFMPAYMSTGFLKEDLESQSLNKLIQEKYHIRLLRSEIWIEAPIITRKEKKLLGNPPLSLFLAVVSVTYDQDNSPVRFTRGIFRGDRVRLKISDASVFDLKYSGLCG